MASSGGDNASMGAGEIVGILEDRCVNDPVYDSAACATPCSRRGNEADDTGRVDRTAVSAPDGALSTGSMVRGLFFYIYITTGVYRLHLRA